MQTLTKRRFAVLEIFSAHEDKIRVALLSGTVAIAIGTTAAMQSTAKAPTRSGYPTATVQHGASTRTSPYLENTYSGYALHNPGTTGDQTVSVTCWYDGDWATGNYATNRWYKVLVWESYDG